jgi:uncharacterized protein (DUF2235 family)
VHQNVEIKCLGVCDTVGSLGIPASILRDANNKEFGFHDTRPSRIVKNGFHAIAIDEHRHNLTPTYWTEACSLDINIKQVWLTGVHSDVGGGYMQRALRAACRRPRQANACCAVWVLASKR